MSDTSGTQENTTPSGLIIPGSEGFKNPTAKGRARGKDVAGPPPSDFEPYPEEINGIRSLIAGIQNRYGFKPMDAQSTNQFENEVTSRFAEELGLVAKVYWKDVDVDGDPNSDTLYFIPTVVLEGRIEAHTTDHEKMARQIQSGELDGKVGTVREDGTFGEAKKKTIQ